MRAGKIRVILDFKMKQKAMWFLKNFIQVFMQCIATIYAGIKIIINWENDDIHFQYMSYKSVFHVFHYQLC